VKSNAWLMVVAVFSAAVATAIVGAGGAAPGDQGSRTHGQVAVPGTIVLDASSTGSSGFDPLRAPIYTIRADGTRLRRLTRESEFAFAPSWSPDGRRIAYISRSLLGFDTPWVMNSDGTGKRQLGRFDVLHGIYNPTLKWSPDGTMIAFARLAPLVGGRHSGKSTIWLVNADGSHPHAVTKGDKIALSPDNDYEPSWSPDGTWLAFVRRGRLWIVRPDGTGAHSITKKVWEVAGQPSWSSDGKLIAYFADDESIWVIRPNGSGKHKLAQSSRLGGLAWSPSGMRLAFTICDDRFAPADCGSIAIVRSDGHNPRVLTKGGANGLPAWSPDGRMIAFANQVHLGTETLNLVRLDTAVTVEIAKIDGDPESIGWQPTSR